MTMKNHRSENNPKGYLLPGCKTRQQMTDEFGWRSVKTFKTKLEKSGINLPSGSITLKWQKLIYEEFGYPPDVAKDAYKDV